MHIDGDRLREDIEANARFGAVDAAEDVGRTVLTGSEADRQARKYFIDRLNAAGLLVRVDPVGNVPAAGSRRAVTRRPPRSRSAVI